MKSSIRLATVLSAATLIAAGAGGAVLAHCAFQASYDTNAPVTLTGKVSAFEWLNPHSLIVMTVAEPGKAPQDWAVLASSPNALLSRGVCRKTLKAGDQITVRGWQSKDKRCLSAWVQGGATHEKACMATAGVLTFANGRSAQIGYGGLPAGLAVADPEACGEVRT